MRRRALFLLLLLTVPVAPALAGPIPRERIPEPLKPWVGWALHGREEELCPFLSGSGDAQCLWPGQLALDLGEREGRFRQTWTLYAEGAVPLPGEERLWPQEIQVDGRPAAAQAKDGAPVLPLSSGTHTVTGAFHWDSLPESLPVPPEVGLVALSVRGAAVPFPERDVSGRLFLQRARVTKAEEDRLEVAVTRRVIDEVPLTLETRIELAVSGRAREVLLGRPLPAGFVPLSIGGPLAARLEPDGRLKVQVRPGSWTVEVAARSAGPVAAITSPPPSSLGGPWAAEEVWVFDARPRLRLVEVSGAPAVDPTQTRLPDDWKKLPAFRLRPGETLRLAERRRGDRPPAPDQIELTRQLWLDFAGTGYTFADKLDGVLHGSWRLEMAPPARLGRVAIDGRDQLITRRLGGKGDGIETRLGALHLAAEGRIESAVSSPALGWDHDFHQVSGVLHLPPGWRLVAATGVDRAPGTWVGRWTLLDLFLVLIAALAVRQLWGTRWGLVALATLVLTWQEPKAPQWLWLAVLATAALLRLLKEGKLRSLVRFLALVAAAGLVLVAVAFLVQELRQGLFPALEHPWVAVGETGAVPAEEEGGGLDVLARHKRAPVNAVPEVQETIMVPKAVPPPAPPAAVREGKLAGSLGSLASPVAAAPEPRAFQEIDPTAVTTTGPGLPQWRWNEVRLIWNGPVEKGERLHLFLLPPAANLALAFLQAALLALLLLRVLPLPAGLPALPPWIATVLLLALVPASALAQGRAEIPPQPILDELRDRLLAPPDCHPDCATAARLALDFTPTALTARLEVGAAAAVGVALPGGAQQWVPAQVAVDGKPAGVTRGEDGRLWVEVEAGRHEILLAGPLPARETVSLPLPLKPHRVTASGTGWTVAGLHEDGVPDDSLTLTRVSGVGAQPAGTLAPAALPPFLAVERTLHLGLLWQVDARVVRQSPAGTPAAVAVPLLPGESVTTPGTRVEKGRVLVSLGAQGDEAAWTSTLAERPRIVLEAPRTLAWTEVWKLDASPVWHVDVSGIPAVVPEGPATPATATPTDAGEGSPAVRTPEWRPWPGERLELAISRPAGVAGPSLTFDRSRLTVTPGTRATAARLELGLRSSRGGEQAIALPRGAVLESVTLGGAPQPLRQEGEKVTLSFPPGAQRAEVAWREPRGIPFLSLLCRTPRIDLGLPSVNATILLEVPEDRWVLLAGGPRLGPAVLFWSLLLVLLLIAAGLARTGLAPLSFRDWALLGLGLSQIPLLGAGLVAGWLLALGWRRRKDTEAVLARHFDLLQVLLVVWSLVALGLLCYAIQQGLLGSPEMQIAGNASTGHQLRWFADRAGRVLPVAWVLSVPILVYRLAMLAWALWLALALLRWLRWGWESLGTGGFWRPLRRSRAPIPAPASASGKEETT
jgi:hypothetical protein